MTYAMSYELKLTIKPRKPFFPLSSRIELGIFGISCGSSKMFLEAASSNSGYKNISFQFDDQVVTMIPLPIPLCTPDVPECITDPPLM